MSFGLHRLWKDTFVRELRPKPYMRILDAAGGTGDIALRISSESRKISPSRPCEVVVTDINQSMLNVGRQKAKQSRATGLSWLRADAEELPFNDNTFDAYTIAFGIRNCTHIEKVLNEALRVLMPGGRFMCLEFSRVRSQLLSLPYDWYSFNIIPVLGRLIANDWTSYRYLVESIRTFPDQQTFAKLIQQSGFQSVTWTNMLCGIVAIHSGYKPTTRPH
ncbi:Ubie methyltran domain containing protein [Trichuris trichiura]|uniref:2-methoxy-6-polyprenyl-1,4-benzoquinol methylase, mitochondrial n=1 Tax=Trichuris trichiura TaxID=36087 RepID=A0A077ZDM5_TRITR|nr:Ubie methyltran domain containing protein [Trichuris trichiura]